MGGYGARPPRAGCVMPAAGIFRWLGVLLAAALATATPAAALPPQAPVRVCFVSLNEPDEPEVFRAHLDPQRFEFIDLRAAPPTCRSAGERGARREPWLLNACRPDVTCDLVVFSAEFAGRFFGKPGFSLSLQEMEEASCQARCAGLFRQPARGVPARVQHAGDQGPRTAARRRSICASCSSTASTAPPPSGSSQLRYGPLGPSFRESLRRIFAGVPRIYGFSSVAPRGEYTAPMLARYLRGRATIARALRARRRRDGQRNRALLACLQGHGADPDGGLAPESEAAAVDARTSAPCTTSRARWSSACASPTGCCCAATRCVRPDAAGVPRAPPAEGMTRARALGAGGDRGARRRARRRARAGAPPQRVGAQARAGPFRRPGRLAASARAPRPGGATPRTQLLREPLTDRGGRHHVRDHQARVAARRLPASTSRPAPTATPAACACSRAWRPADPRVRRASCRRWRPWRCGAAGSGRRTRSPACAERRRVLLERWCPTCATARRRSPSASAGCCSPAARCRPPWRAPSPRSIRPWCRRRQVVAGGSDHGGREPGQWKKWPPLTSSAWPVIDA